MYFLLCFVKETLLLDKAGLMFLHSISSVTGPSHSPKPLKHRETLTTIHTHTHTQASFP